MKKTRLHADCIRCVVTRELNNIPPEASEEQRIEYMLKMLNEVSKCDPEDGPPVVQDRIFAVRDKMFGPDQKYIEIKKQYNQIMMNKEDVIWEKITSHEDPLKAMICFAMIGNYIDFGVLSEIDDNKLEELLQQAIEMELNQETYDRFVNELNTKKTLTYLTDNCGEIVIDKLFIRYLKKQHPNLNVTVMVRGEPVLNDATMDDAIQVGMTEEAKVIGNGSSVAGTWLGHISEEAQTLVEQSDIIISKGQANFETLCGCGLNVYYMFLCKCELFTERFDVEMFHGMFLNDDEY